MWKIIHCGAKQYVGLKGPVKHFCVVSLLVDEDEKLKNTFVVHYTRIDACFLFQDYNDEIRQEQMWEMHILNRSSSPNLSNPSNKNGDLSSGIIDKSTSELLSNGVMLPVSGGGVQSNNVTMSKATNNNILINNNNISNYGTSSSNGSLTPPELPNSVSPTSMLMSHPAMRGLKTKAVGLSSPPLSGK